MQVLLKKTREVRVRAGILRMERLKGLSGEG